jgi:hypothetical protein
MTEKAKQDDKVELLSKDDILAAPDLTFEIVEVPEWGGKVRVKALTGTERDAFESSMLQGTGKNQKISTQDIRAKLCARTIVDMEDKRLFNDGEIGKLGAKSAAALDRVYGVASRLSKISSEDVEELAKNSGIGLSEDS